ncbi:MAG: PTS mannitol transporter subunit IICBA [Lachnospiraceae bacterium]|nr:PTS mannitol transporter subunit IICBA [Lachnospiraceae bacterium]MCI9183421.1 PTS mannitol transporter subunit IICBA [Lachnospiraceae bacterium]
MKNYVQRFGKFLSAMVMPNIGALIAFGFLAALFIDTGWIPNKGFNSMVGPMLTYLIPVLIASTGGRMVGGDRGRVVGAIAVIGAVMSDTSITMLMAAMVIGPLAGFCIKKFDEAMDGHMPAGFEMLINNFSAGIFGMLLAMLGYLVIGPVMSGILQVMSAGVNTLVEHELLPLVAVFIEPAKVLFLNNAINHGIFTPIATAQAAEAGKSIMYMLEPNPGPGLGVLLAYMFFCKDKATKDSAPGAVIIHLLGGIHEIYFPYILMNPLVIIAPIVGNIAAIFWFNMTGCGLVGPASPGSIIAYLMMAPGPDMVKIVIGVLISAGISFAIASFLVKMAGNKSLEEAQQEMAAMKAQAKGEAPVPGTIERSSEIKKIVFACDAGMGSSAMGATKFRNRIKSGRPDITVTNTSVDNIPADCDIAVVQATLADRAKKSAPQAQLITIGNFLADPALDALYVQLSTGDAPAAPAGENTDIVIPDVPIKKQVIIEEGIHLGRQPVSKEEAIQAAGEMLVKLGYVDETYIDAMQEREKLVSTYIGMGVAIPHGTTQAKGTVKKTGIVFFQYPEGVDFGAEKAQLVFGIAGIGDEHLDLLSKLCTLLEDPARLETLKSTDDKAWVLEQLS